VRKGEIVTDFAAQIKPVFNRMEMAQTSFIADVMEQFGFTQTEAEKILRVYRKLKVMKLDVAMGRYNLVHGAFWEKAPMLAALAVVEK
jgi:hypothetical protein